MLDETDAEITARRKSKADYMRAYGRRRGAMPVKGTTFPCERCGLIVERTSFRQKWCSECQPKAQAEAAMWRRKMQGKVVRGMPRSCNNCGASFEPLYKTQAPIYCEPCSALARKEALPAYRKRQNEYMKARNKRRRDTIPAVSIHERMSAGIRNSLADGKNGRSWESLVGYSIEDLMAHLERQFLNGMSWDNRGEWHIDHILPLASFSFNTVDDPDFKACWALSNLRPLWSTENIKKSARRTLLL